MSKKVKKENEVKRNRMKPKLNKRRRKRKKEI